MKQAVGVGDESEGSCDCHTSGWHQSGREAGALTELEERRLRELGHLQGDGAEPGLLPRKLGALRYPRVPSGSLKE